MITVLLVLMVIVWIFSCLFLIVVILGQEGKGGGLSGLVGASALGDTLGASAAESTLRRWTRNCAVLFIFLSLILTIIGPRVFKGSIIEKTLGTAPSEEGATPPSEQVTTAPATLPGGMGRPSAAPITVPPTGPVSKPTPSAPVSTPAAAPAVTPGVSALGPVPTPAASAPTPAAAQRTPSAPPAPTPGAR